MADFLRYTDKSCAAFETAAPERKSERLGLKYDTGSTPELCMGGGIPSKDAPKEATSACSMSHRSSSLRPHSASGVGASFPRGTHAISTGVLEAVDAIPAPQATKGVSVHPGSPSPCAPLLLMPWSAVNRNAVPPSSGPNRSSNAAASLRTPASTTLMFSAYPSPLGLCACPALSSPRRCSRNTTLSPSSALRSVSKVAPARCSSSVILPTSTSMARSNTHSSRAA